jgi:radical SAM superfamily enzyme YgiQ (UPF0313 family)
MHYTGEVYRHPMEGYTPLLEVTIGCSYNKCAFCTMYQRTPFITTKMEIIEEDLKELKAKSKGEAVKRICLVNADPFVLSTDKLIAISDLIIKYFPEIETITGYASIRNFTKKTPKDLLRLKAARFNDFHIGLESGYDPALKTINKGYTAKEARAELKKIKEAGLRWDALLMMGVAGKGNGSKNIEATAKLLNEFPPYMISLMPMSVTPGSKLEIITNRGEYVELTERELLEEEKEFLEALMFEDCYFFGSHNFNLIPISGKLKDKAKIIEYIDEKMNELSATILSSVKPRGAI